MYSDLDRPPLRVAALTRALVVPDGLWREVRVVGTTGSTNADVAQLARTGEPEGVVLVAEQQTAGRGRLDRTWQSPPRSGLTFSVLLRPDPVPPARRGWLPLIAGLAVAEAIRAVAEVQARVKWPNDVLVDGRKVAGVLSEATGDAAVVVGFGINVSTRPDELPVPEATSLAVAQATTTDRDTVLRAVLRTFEARYRAWRESGGAPPRPDYLAVCATIGRTVRVSLPGGATVDGEAVDVDRDGRLLVRDASGATVPVAAGDVLHVRAAD